MYIASDEDIFNEDGDCLYDDLIVLSWRQLGSEAIKEFTEKLEFHGIDLVEYNLGNSDFLFRLIKKI